MLLQNYPCANETEYFLPCHLERRANDRREQGRSRKIAVRRPLPCSFREFSPEHRIDSGKVSMKPFVSGHDLTGHPR